MDLYPSTIAVRDISRTLTVILKLFMDHLSRKVFYYFNNAI